MRSVRWRVNLGKKKKNSGRIKEIRRGVGGGTSG